MDTDIFAWYNPIMEEELDPDKIILDPDNYLYRQTFDAAKYLCEESGGRYLVSMPDNCGVLDGLAAIRGNENLLMDLLDEGAITAADLDGFSDDLRDSLLTYIELRKRRENQ